MPVPNDGFCQATGHLAQFPSISPGTPNRIVRPRRRRFFGHSEGNQLFCYTLGLLVGQHRPAYEIAFIQGNEEP